MNRSINFKPSSYTPCFKGNPESVGRPLTRAAANRGLRGTHLYLLLDANCTITRIGMRELEGRQIPKKYIRKFKNYQNLLKSSMEVIEKDPMFNEIFGSMSAYIAKYGHIL